MAGTSNQAIAAETVAQIALDMPINPTSADLLAALTRAEASGFARGLRTARQAIEVEELEHVTDPSGGCVAGCQACALTTSVLLQRAGALAG